MGRGHCGRKIIQWKWKLGPTSRKFCAIGQNTHFCVSCIVYQYLCFRCIWSGKRAVKSKFDVCQQYATLPKLEAYFQSQKFYGSHSHQTISVIGWGHCGKKSVQWKWGWLAEDFALLDKIHILRVMYQFMFSVASERQWAVKSKFDVCQQYATLPKLEAYFQ